MIKNSIFITILTLTLTQTLPAALQQMPEAANTGCGETVDWRTFEWPAVEKIDWRKAARYAHEETVISKFLSINGFPTLDQYPQAINADRNRLTLLHIIAKTGITRIVKLLLAHGANVNARDMNGRTPLHIALDNRHTDIARLLIKHGADVNARDINGKKPSEFALRHKLDTLVALLREHGAIE